jgi:hypothetical protein
MRYSISTYPYNPSEVCISSRRFAVVVPRDVAQRFEELVKLARPRGSWQLELLLELARGRRIPATAAHLVRGRAAAYLGRYQASLEALMGRLGARLVLGPRGGRWAGYYELPQDGE